MPASAQPPEDEIDVETAAAGLLVVIDEFHLFETGDELIDECPLGEPGTIATTVGNIVETNYELPIDASAAFVSLDTLGTGCRIGSLRQAESGTGVYYVVVHAGFLDDAGLAMSVERDDEWVLDGETNARWNSGELRSRCWSGIDTFDDDVVDCWTTWRPDRIGMFFGLTLWSEAGQLTARDASIVLQELLPYLIENLAERA